jgi:hypothetical protein
VRNELNDLDPKPYTLNLPPLRNASNDSIENRSMAHLHAWDSCELSAPIPCMHRVYGARFRVWGLDISFGFAVLHSRVPDEYPANFSNHLVICKPHPQPRIVIPCVDDRYVLTILPWPHVALSLLHRKIREPNPIYSHSLTAPGRVCCERCAEGGGVA